jgi:AcrR family transcriptional regulator
MSDEPEEDLPPLPPGIELAWGLRGRPRRGPKPGLTLERIVAAGIKVAATEGVGVLSMGRVASELGVGTMSLYRYVAAKDELLTLMVDAAIGAPPGGDHPEEDWRAALTRWAVGVRAAYRRHPWALRVPISGQQVLGPNNVAWLEAGLRALGSTALSEQDKAATVLLVSGFVRGEATLNADLAAGWFREPSMTYGALMERLTDPIRFPAIRRAIASGAFDDDDNPDAQFHYGLGRILDGIGRLDASPGGGAV